MAKNTVILESLPSISISEIKKAVRFYRIGTASYTISVQHRGKPVGSIGVTAHIDFPETISYLQLRYECNGETISDKIELRFVRSNLKRGCVVYFVCPISKESCRKLYLCKNSFKGRRGIKRAYYGSELVSGKKRQNLKYTLTLGKATGIAKTAQQPYFMQFYNGSPTKKYLRVVEAVQKLNSSL
jgi:hypothetical protein